MSDNYIADNIHDCYCISKTIELFVGENKSTKPTCFSCVRVFLGADYSYGYFINELLLFNLLTEEQQKKYCINNSYENTHFYISVEVANKIVDNGSTILRKYYFDN